MFTREGTCRATLAVVPDQRAVAAVQPEKRASGYAGSREAALLRFTRLRKRSRSPAAIGTGDRDLALEMESGSGCSGAVHVVHPNMLGE